MTADVWPKQQKNGTPCFWAELTFEWCESAMIFRVFIFIFILFRSNDKKNTWMRTTFIKVMIIIPKMPFLKLIDISCFQS